MSRKWHYTGPGGDLLYRAISTVLGGGIASVKDPDTKEYREVHYSRGQSIGDAIRRGQFVKHTDKRTGTSQSNEASSDEKEFAEDNSAVGILFIALVVFVLLAPFLIVYVGFVLPIQLLIWVTHGRDGYGWRKNRSLLTKIGSRIAMGCLGLLALMVSLGTLSLALEGIQPYFDTAVRDQFLKSSNWFEWCVMAPVATIGCVLWVLAAGIAGAKLILFGRFYAEQR